MGRLIPTGGNDEVMTPDDVALDVVRHFADQVDKNAKVLEPCAGQGAFVRAYKECGFTNIEEKEITRDPKDDFFLYEGKADWIITNPPWSLARRFWQKGYEVADDIVFLITVNHLLALKARLRDMREAGFNIKEIYLVDTPPEPWPQSGFQLGAIHVQRGWTGKLTFK
jgi:hypothetical protein